MDNHFHSWDEIVELVSSNQLHKLKRNKAAQDVYQEWIDKTLIEYGTVENYLIKEKVHFPEGNDILILHNDFPYSTEPGIEHILIWSKAPLEAKVVENILKENYDNLEWDWTYFVNPPELQSVKRLPHVHVFMRKKVGEEQQKQITTFPPLK